MSICTVAVCTYDVVYSKEQTPRLLQPSPRSGWVPWDEARSVAARQPDLLWLGAPVAQPEQGKGRAQPFSLAPKRKFGLFPLLRNRQSSKKRVMSGPRLKARLVKKASARDAFVFKTDMVGLFLPSLQCAECCITLCGGRGGRHCHDPL